jgi:peptidoglycan hydrolase CwlO-like protein
MSTEDEIAQKEKLIAIKKNNIALAKDIPDMRDSIEETKKEIESLEEAIKHLRKIQLAEAKIPRKESLLDNILIYFIVGILIAVTAGLILYLFKI